MQTTAKLIEHVTPLLKEDEQILVTGFALQGFSAAIEIWILIVGLYVLGSLLILILSDRVFIVLTNQRLIVIELTPKYLYVSEIRNYPLVLVESVDLTQSGIYKILNCQIARQTFRWRFPSSNLNFASNGDNALKLAGMLKQLQADESPQSRELQQQAFDLIQQAQNTQRPRSRGWFWTILLGIPMVFVAMIGVAVMGSAIVGDLQQASTATVLLFSAITFLVTPVIVFVLLRLLFGSTWSMEDDKD